MSIEIKRQGILITVRFPGGMIATGIPWVVLGVLVLLVAVAVGIVYRWRSGKL
jgi:hypothetical protein